MSTLPPVMVVEDVAALLKCSPRTVEDRARAGTLPGVKFGESWVFPAQALLEAINEQARANTTRTAPKQQPQRQKARPPALHESWRS